MCTCMCVWVCVYDTTFLRHAAVCEVKDKRKTIDALKRALAEAKEHEKKSLHETTKEWEDKMHNQKALEHLTWTSNINDRRLVFESGKPHCAPGNIVNDARRMRRRVAPAISGPCTK